MKKDKYGKPIIRHCQNCKWHGSGIIGYECKVKYQNIKRKRLAALLCRHYECREE